ncbi:MAG: FecR domain-containing protein [Fibrobacterota bacterium]
MHVTDSIEALCHEGGLPPDIAAFKTHLQACAQCRSLLEERLTFSQALAEQNRKPALTDEEWDTLAAAAIGQDGPLLDDHEWDSLVEKAVPHKPEAARGNVLPFHFSTAVYAMAAGLIMLISGFTFFHFQRPTQSNPGPSSTALRPAYAKPIALTGQSQALPSKGARLRVIKNIKQEAKVSLEEGAALFQVTPNTYHAYVVSTPDAEITVTGTIFDVWIQEGKTRVSVIEGSVHVLYRALNRTLILSANEQCRIKDGKTSVQTMGPSDINSLQPYINILTPPASPPHGALPIPPIIPAPVKNLASESSSSEIPPDIKAWLNAGLLLSAKGDPAGALAQFEKIILAPSQGRAQETAIFKSALLLAGPLKKPEEGIRRLQEYSAGYPSGVYAEETLAELIKISRYQGALDNVLKYEKEYLDRFGSGALATDYRYETATLLREKKDFNAAADHYRRFTETAPADVRTEDAYFWLGKCLVALNRSSEMESVYRQYLEKYPQGRWLEEIRKVKP